MATDARQFAGMQRGLDIGRRRAASRPLEAQHRKVIGDALGVAGQHFDRFLHPPARPIRIDATMPALCGGGNGGPRWHMRFWSPGAARCGSNDRVLGRVLAAARGRPLSEWPRSHAPHYADGNCLLTMLPARRRRHTLPANPRRVRAWMRSLVAEATGRPCPTCRLHLDSTRSPRPPVPCRSRRHL